MEIDRKTRYDGSYDDGDILMFHFRISMLSLFQKNFLHVAKIQILSFS